MKASVLNTLSLCVLLLAYFSSLSASQFITVSSELEVQRKLFQKLIDDNKLGNIQIKDLPQTLQTYPLAPYVQYYYLINRLGREPMETFSVFFEQHDGLASSSYLRKQLLLYLGRQEQWESFNDFYKPDEYFFSDNNLLELNCYHLQSNLFIQAQANESKLPLINEQDRERIQEIYLQDYALPESCTTLVNMLESREALSQELQTKKIQQALKDNQLSIADVLSKNLDKEHALQFKLCKNLLKKPALLEDKTFNLIDNAFNRTCITKALEKLVDRDPPLALTLWNEQQEKYKFNSNEKQEFKYTVALGLYLRDSEHFLSWIEPPEKNPELNEKALVEYIKQADWSTIISLYPKLSSKERNDSAWQYWYARSYIEYDQNHNIHPNAYRILDQLSRKRDYYGFLASFHLNSNPALSNHRFPIKEVELERIANKANIIRAHEFYILGDRPNATREWYYAKQEFTAEQKGVAAVLAYQWGWLEQAIITASNSNQFNNIALRFPLGFSKQVNYFASKYNIPNEWVFATIRQESAFGVNAESSAGALGLMQIMPYTGEVLAKENKIKNFSNSDLFIPQTNLQLGTYYLAKLRKQYQGNMLIASAAYNAGPSTVNSWIRRSPDMDIEMWIETIPYKETRNYVKNILTYQIIYQDLLGRETNPERFFLPIK